MKREAIILNPKDNVATAISDLEAGNVVEMEMDKNTISVRLVDAIPFGHKLSLSHIESDSPVIKYGEVIGMATADIQPGQHVHVHNVASARARGDLVKEAK